MKKLVAAALLLVAVPAFADTRWERTHPRRDEVNDRLANQHARVNAGVREGQLTHGEARQIHREDHTIRAEERAMAAEHGGHITAREQTQLNRQENHVSRQIHRERQQGR